MVIFLTGFVIMQIEEVIVANNMSWSCAHIHTTTTTIFTQPCLGHLCIWNNILSSSAGKFYCNSVNPSLPDPSLLMNWWWGECPYSTKTLPEAQRTQGIESVTWQISFGSTNFKFISVGEIIQVIDLIPWVRCASGNVFFILSLKLSNI